MIATITVRIRVVVLFRILGIVTDSELHDSRIYIREFYLLPRHNTGDGILD